MNTNKQKTPTAHKNYMDGKSYDMVDPLMTLHMQAASGFFGERKYYDSPRQGHDETTRSMIEKSLGAAIGNPFAVGIEAAIDACLAKCPEDVLAYALYLRKDALMRTTPQVIVARAAHCKALKGTGLISKYTEACATRLDDCASGMAYYLKTFGRPIPNGLRRGYGNRIQRADGNILMKYKQDSRDVSLEDVIRLCRCSSPDIDRFMKGTLPPAKTWETMRASGMKWKDIIRSLGPHFGHMALLRNLRGILAEHAMTLPVLSLLKSGVLDGKQFPFRYLSAYRVVEGTSNDNVHRALEECMEISVRNLPLLGGRTLVATDYSGSAQGIMISKNSGGSKNSGDESVGTHICDVGGLTGLLLCRASAKGGEVCQFGDTYTRLPVDETSRILASMADLNTNAKSVGTATENGAWLILRDAIKNKTHFDRIVILSDMQAGTGGLYGIPNSRYQFEYPTIRGHRIDIPKLFKQYRQEVNPNCVMYSIQIAGYSDNVFPEYYDHAVVLSGWSTEIPKFIAAYESGVNLRDELTKYRL